MLEKQQQNTQRKDKNQEIHGCQTGIHMTTWVQDLNPGHIKMYVGGEDSNPCSTFVATPAVYRCILTSTLPPPPRHHHKAKQYGINE